MRIRRIFLFSSFFILLSLAIVLFFLSMTESGLNFLQGKVNSWAKGTMSIGQTTGRLLSDFTLENIRYSSEGVDISLERLEFSWRPQNLLKGELRFSKVQLKGVDILFKEVVGAEKKEPVLPEVEKESIKLPTELISFPVVLDDFQLERLRMIDTDGELLLALDTGKVSLQADRKRLTIGEFDFQGPDFGLAIHGNIEVWQDWNLEMIGKWHLAGYGFHHMEGSFSTSGPLHNPHVEVGLHFPVNIRVSGDLVNLLDKPEWTATLLAENVDLSKWIEDCPKIELGRVDGDLHGDFSSYLGEVRADMDWHTLKGVQLVTDIVGSGWGIDFTSLDLKSDQGSARAEGGKISWSKIFSWEGHFWFENFDPLFFSEKLQGKLNAELINKGDVTENGNVIATFDIQSLDGLLHNHLVGAAGVVQLIETEVRTDGLILSSGELEGKARIETGMFSWGEELGWAGEILFENFDPASLNPSFPGSINGTFQGEGTYSDKGVKGWLDIQNISGVLRKNKISGGGKLRLSPDKVETKGVVLKSGPSTLQIKGKAGEVMGLDFSLRSPDLNTIMPEAKGQLDLRGTLQGSLQKPQFDMTLQGSALGYKKEHLNRLEGKLQAIIKDDGAVSGSFQGDGLSVYGFAAERFEMNMSGRLAKHQIEIESEGTWGTLGFRVAGGYDSDWQGQVSEFKLNLPDYGLFNQQQRAEVTLGAQQISLGNFCLSSGGGSACLQGGVQLGPKLVWQVGAKLTAFPLKLLNLLEPSVFQVKGALNGEIVGKGNMDAILSAGGTLQAEDAYLQLSVGKGEMEGYLLEKTSLNLEIQDELFTGALDVFVEGGSQLRLKAEVNGLGKFGTQPQSLPLGGSLDLKDFDLRLISDFTGYGVEPTGWVSNSLKLDGTLGRPEIYGDISIGNGGVYLPYQGITLENIVLSINAAGEKARVNGSATSGPGQLTAGGVVQYGQDGIEAVLNLKGNNFLLVDLPEYTLRVNPEVKMKLTRDRGEISGVIVVPYGQITPEEMSDSVSASEDVIVIDGDVEERMKSWPFRLDLNVQLGEQVLVEGYGLSGRVGGNLSLNTNPNDTIAGRGELDLIDGTFTVYGRTLSIERGRMLFTGGPIGNPGVDVRAQVRVGDDEARGEGYTVGVDIGGLVQNLEYHLFSDPFMEDTEILSLMIVGHSLAGSTQDETNLLEAAAVTLGTKGSKKFVKNLGDIFFLDDLHLEGSSNKENVSLVVGKRLTKDIYIGYDLNMFSQVGQFRVRYDLIKGFSVETKSSAESTGADLLFSFER